MSQENNPLTQEPNLNTANDIDQFIKILILY
jgi:hypothetical protein